MSRLFHKRQKRVKQFSKGKNSERTSMGWAQQQYATTAQPLFRDILITNTVSYRLWNDWDVKHFLTHCIIHTRERIHCSTDKQKRYTA